MNKLIKLSAILAVACIAQITSYAGEFSLSLSGPGGQSGNAVVPSSGSVQEACGSSNVGTGNAGTASVTGPLGTFDVSPQGPPNDTHDSQYQTGSCSAGTYACAVTVFNNGYSVVVITW